MSITTSTQTLTAKHYQELTGKRGLQVDWVLINATSQSANEATQYLGYIAQSDGIMLSGCNGQKQFKPDKPWKAEGGKKAAPKYRSQLGEYDAMLPTHPTNLHYWDDIEALKELCWKIEGRPCLVITEGFFKAIAGCSNGIPTISLLGVDMGQTAKNADPQGKRYLVPVLERYAKAGFGFIFAFDADCVDNLNVLYAQRRLVHGLQKFKTRLYNATGLWTVTEGKGMDDYIQGNGADKFKREVLGKVVDIEAWEKQFEAADAAAARRRDDEDYVGEGTIESLILDTIFEEGQGKWRTIDDAFYKDTGKGYWAKVPDKSVLKDIALKCKKAWETDKHGVEKHSFFTDSKKKSSFLVCRDALDISTAMPANQHLRCFRNCTVDMRTGRAMSHDKNHFLTTVIDSEYYPNKPCPKAFLDFIKTAYGEDLIDSIRAAISMLLDPTAPYGFFIHLIGASGSGKGTLLRLFKDMFGLEHSRSGDFKNLSTAEGRHQYLTGAALFTVPDVGGYIQGLKPFYELVDNGSMSGRALFSSSGYDKVWNTRFIIASVDHLQIENSGDGWDRRCIPLPTKPRVGLQDPDLAKKLAAVKGEIISWALAMPREERDSLLLHPSSNERVINLKQEAAIQGDPVRAFADLCLRPALPNSPKIPTHDLHSKFFAFAQAHGYQGRSMSKFASHLKTILPKHYVARRRKLGTKEFISAHWAGMVFLPGTFVEGKNATTLDPDWQCIKPRCSEGGLTAFAEFDCSPNPPACAANPLKVDEQGEHGTMQGFQDSAENFVQPTQKVDAHVTTQGLQTFVQPVHPGGGLPLRKNENFESEKKSPSVLESPPPVAEQGEQGEQAEQKNESLAQSHVHPVQPVVQPTQKVDAQKVDAQAKSSAESLAQFHVHPVQPVVQPALAVGDRVAGAHPTHNDYHWVGEVKQIYPDAGMAIVEWQEGQKIPTGDNPVAIADLRRLHR